MSQPEEEDDGGFFAFVVDRPVAVAMIFAAAVVFGLVSLARLPLALMPDLSYPSLTVRTEYPGAAPEEVETQVSRPIEEALSTADGLVGIESRSRAEVSDVVLEFDWGTDMASASQGVRERLQTTWLGDGVERPLILHYDPSLDPVLRLALSGERPLAQLRELAEEDLKRSLEALDGVAAVRVRGGLEREIRIELREDWMAAHGVAQDAVIQTLNAENVNVAGGSIREGDSEYLVRTLAELTSVEEVAALRVRKADGTSVPIGELAVVREATADQEVVSRLGGREAVELEVFREADANLVDVAEAVKAGVQGGLNLPSGVEVVVLDDQSRFVTDSIENLRESVIVGGILSVVVLFLFLADFRATMVAFLAVPICLVCTFASLYLADASLNLMSLGGLALGVGMVVDTSVVVLEAMQVYLDRGLDRRRAAIKATREVAMPVASSILANVAVFAPIAFVEGVAGQVFGDLALGVIGATLASLAVSLVLVPALAAREPGDGRWVEWRTLKPSPREWSPLQSFRIAREEWRQAPGLWAALRFPFRVVVEAVAQASTWVAEGVLGLGSALGGLVVPPAARRLLSGARRFGAAFDRQAGAYDRLLAAAMRAPGTVLGLSTLALILAASLPLGQELIPEVHQGRFAVELALPVGTPLDRTQGRLAEAELRLGEHPDVETLYAVAGTERRADARPDEGEHTARLHVQLKPGDLDGRQERVVAWLREGLSDLEFQVRVAPPALFSVRTPVEVVVFGPELAGLRASADAAVERLARVPGLVDVRSSLQPGYPELRLRYRREILDRMGLSTSAVAQAVRTRIQGTEATRLARGEKRLDMVVRLDERDRSTLEDLERLNVNPAVTPTIPLGAVATIESAEGPSEIRRVDQRRAAVIGANLSGLDLASTGAAVRSALSGLPLGPEQSWEIAGQTLEMERSLRSMGFALALATFLVYAIMAMSFESLRHPLVILFALPLAAVGVAPALFATGTPVSVVVFIGLIVLAGVVVNNAIVLVDRINQLRDEGMDVDSAILAAGRSRLRPILITTITSVLGTLPLALGLGAGAEIQQPLGITVIAGMSSSTLLTLVVIPAIYRLAERR